MSTKKRASLRSIVASDTADAVPPPGEGRQRGASDSRPHRTGKVNVSAFVPESVHKQMLLVKVRKDGRVSNQDLVLEGLGLLFEKYGVVGAR
jgi:hypothetical protein